MKWWVIDLNRARSERWLPKIGVIWNHIEYIQDGAMSVLDDNFWMNIRNECFELCWNNEVLFSRVYELVNLAGSRERWRKYMDYLKRNKISWKILERLFIAHENRNEWVREYLDKEIHMENMLYLFELNSWIELNILKSLSDISDSESMFKYINYFKRKKIEWKKIQAFFILSWSLNIVEFKKFLEKKVRLDEQIYHWNLI